MVLFQFTWTELTPVSIYRHWNGSCYYQGKQHTGSDLSQAQCEKPQLSPISLQVFGKLPLESVLEFLHKEVLDIFKELFCPLKCICKCLNRHEDLSHVLCPPAHFKINEGNLPLFPFLFFLCLFEKGERE